LKGARLYCPYHWNNGPHPRVDVVKYALPAAELAGQGPMAYANTDVYDELRHGNDPRFDELRKDVLFERFFEGSIASETSCDDARAYAKKLIGVSGEYS
jgi:hypothetical protein